LVLAAPSRGITLTRRLTRRSDLNLWEHIDDAHLVVLHTRGRDGLLRQLVEGLFVVAGRMLSHRHLVERARPAWHRHEQRASNIERRESAQDALRTTDHAAPGAAVWSHRATRHYWGVAQIRKRIDLDAGRPLASNRHRGKHIE
jgi:hypothetical protein